MSGNILARLQQIDDLARPDHYYLTSDDRCYYWGEYTARKGYAFSDTNGLILNFKKSVARRGRPEWRYKEQAIARAASMFRAAIREDALPQITLVPIPPSKARNHPEYDDRMLQMLQQIGRGRDADIRELVAQTESIEAAHDADVRPRPEDLIAIYAINESVAEPSPQNIFVFDDVLTTGCHFKAMKQVLSVRFPNVPVLGLFIARRVPDTSEFEDFDDLNAQ